MECEILDIVIKVFKEEASLEDKQTLIKWINGNQCNLEKFRQSESIWNAIGIISSGGNFDSDRAFEKFKEKISKNLKNSKQNRFIKTIDRLLRIAAIIVIFLGASYFLFFKSGKGSVSSDSSICEIKAPRGAKTELLLHDGTKVWLNSESKINFRSDFNLTDREIYLEGEGYFEVTGNPDKPFVVSTSNLKIKAIGTSFNIKSYPGEGVVETTLVEGKIEVESKLPGQKTKLVTLEPNQKAVFYKNPAGLNQSPTDGNAKSLDGHFNQRQVVLNENVDAALTVSWKDNILYFENESFQNLALKLERRFGVNIHFMDESIKQLHFSGKFKDIIIEQILAALQFASPFYYTFNDKDIYISEKPLKATAANRNTNIN